MREFGADINVEEHMLFARRGIMAVCGIGGDNSGWAAVLFIVVVEIIGCHGEETMVVLRTEK